MSSMILPGVYIDVRPEGLIAPGQITVGNVGVVGTAANGPIGIPVILGSFADAQRIYGNYDAWIDGKQHELTLTRALELICGFGATTVYGLRVADNFAQGAAHATKAQHVLAAQGGGKCVTLQALNEGTWGNSLLVNVTDADDQAYIEDEPHIGAGVATVKLKHSPVVKSALNRIELNGRSLQIQYDSNAGLPPGTVSVATNTGTLTFGGPVPTAGDKIVVSYAVAQASACKVTLKLGSVQESYNVADGDNLIAIVNDPNTPSAWVRAIKEASSGELPARNANADVFAPFSGGTNGETASAADYKAGLDALLYQDVQIVVAAGQDDSFGNKLDQHCQQASTDAVKRDRIAVVGSGLGANIDKIRSHNLNSDRVIFVAPGIKNTDSASGQEVTLPGAYGAAAVAGLLASFAPNVSLTNKQLDVDDLDQYFEDAQLAQLVLSRVLVVENKNGFKLVKGITTSDGGAFTQITTRRIVDYAKYGVRSAADPYIGLLNNERVRDALRATLNSFLSGMVDDELLDGYDLDVTASRADEIAGIARVDMTLQPTFSIDYIKVTMYLQ